MVDTIVLYDYDTSYYYDIVNGHFLNNGFGILDEATKCLVTEERNGGYEVEIEYPMKGRRFNDLGINKVIAVKPNKYTDKQMFRIYQITKPLKGLVTIKAQHISYDMSGYPVAFPMSSSTTTPGWYPATYKEGASNIITAIKDFSKVSHNFKFIIDGYTDTTTRMYVITPTSTKSLIGGSDNSFLSLFGGELEYNNYEITIHKKRGQNRGVTIRYGKNLTDINQEEQFSNMYTGVYTYCCLSKSPEYEGDLEKYQLYDLSSLYPSGIYPITDDNGSPISGIQTRIYSYDCMSDWNDTQNSQEYHESDAYPSYEEMIELTKKLIEKEKLNKPDVSLTFSFQPLSNTTEYSQFGTVLEDVRLCDEVTVIFEQLNITVTDAVVTKIVYNVLTDKYDSIEIGEKSKLTDNFVN